MIVKTSLRFRTREQLALAVSNWDELSVPERYRAALEERRKAVLGDHFRDPRGEGPRVDVKVRVGKRWRIVKASIDWRNSDCHCGSCSPWSGVVLTLGRNDIFEHDDRGAS